MENTLGLVKPVWFAYPFKQDVPLQSYDRRSTETSEADVLENH